MSFVDRAEAHKKEQEQLDAHIQHIAREVYTYRRDGKAKDQLDTILDGTIDRWELVGSGSRLAKHPRSICAYFTVYGALGYTETSSILFPLSYLDGDWEAAELVLRQRRQQMAAAKAAADAERQQERELVLLRELQEKYK